MVVLHFQPPAFNERGPAHLESLMDGWAAMCGHQGFRLGIVSRHGLLVFLIDVPESCNRIVAMQLLNAYPGSQIHVLNDDLLRKHPPWCYFRLAPDAYPLKLHSQFIDTQSGVAIDPIESLMEAIKTGQSGKASVDLWLNIQPCKPKQLEQCRRNSLYLKGHSPLPLVKSRFKFHASRAGLRSRMIAYLLREVSWPSAPPVEAEQKLTARLFTTTLELSLYSESNNAKFANRKKSEVASALKLLTHPSSSFSEERKAARASFLLTAAEIATLWHIPTTAVHVPRIEKQEFIQLEPPPNLVRPTDHPNILTLGRICFRNENYRFGIDMEARRRHLWILGKTGMGKSTLLQSIIHQDLEAGRGLAILEPHGDLVQSSLKLVPKRRKNDVIYFDPANSANLIGFNPLLVTQGSDKTLVADGVLSAFQKVFGLDESAAPRLLHIFRNSLLSLVELPQATLMDVQRLLVEPLFRKSVIARVSNPVVRSFWLDEFGKWSHNDRTMFIASLQNKLGAFLTNEKLQRMLGDPKAKLNLRQIMDGRKVLIVNLSKGRLGEEASNLLGTLLATCMQLAAMSRADTLEADRHDFSIVIDEFQNFATPSIATFLSEARKYRTHLVIANQYTEQIAPEILAAIIGNVGSQVLFQLGPTDAERFSQTAFSSLTPKSLMNIPKYHAYAKILQDGMQTAPFSMQTIPTR